MLRTILRFLPPLILVACQSLEFQQSSVTEVSYDPAVMANKVVLQFQVVDAAGLPVSDLDPADIRVLENGVPTGAEAMAKTTRQQHPVEVAVLLDRSASVYESGAIADLQAAATDLVAGLAQHPCTVQLYSFARTLTHLDSLQQLPTKAEGEAEHWTALYRAVQEALERHPDGIVVVLTDGADNYSQNLGGPTLAALVGNIAAHKRMVHAIGFGTVDQEYDHDGVNGAAALRRLTVYGTYARLQPPAPAGAKDAGAATGDGATTDASAKSGDGTAADAKAGKPAPPTASDLAATVVTEVARRIPTTYTYEYYSPNLSGAQTLRIEASRQGVRGTSKQLQFMGAGPAPAPDAAAPKDDQR